MTKASKKMVFFVLLVVILSIFFTWTVLDNATETKSSTSDGQSFEEGPVAGKIGLNLVSNTEETNG